MSTREWERRSRESLAAAHERRARTHADPLRAVAWAGAILVSLGFWTIITVIAVAVL